MLFPRLALYVDLVPRDGALNMAIDEVLAHSTGEAAMRVYAWDQPTVTFGYFGRYSDVAGRWPGRALVRRWTGGGEVAHGDDFTYTICTPRSHGFCGMGVRDSYRAIHAVLAPLLPGATLAEADAVNAPGCFARPVIADVVMNGRKVAGAAQRRGAFGLLHQGSVQGLAWPANLATNFAIALAATIDRRELPPAVLAKARLLTSEKYSTDAWLKRR